MTLVKDKLEYEDSKKLSNFKQENKFDIRYKSTASSLWFLAKKHSAGLKTIAILFLTGYIVYDKIARFFL